MTDSLVAKKDRDNFVDRRATERYDIDMQGVLHVHGESYPIVIKDISIYGMGISAIGSNIEDGLHPQQEVLVEWGLGEEEIHAVVVWSYKGRYGFVVKPALSQDHPLIAKGKSLQDD